MEHPIYSVIRISSAAINGYYHSKYRIGSFSYPLLGFSFTPIPTDASSKVLNCYVLLTKSSQLEYGEVHRF